MFLPLLLLFTVLPIIELALLIRIGRVIHLGPTLALVVITGMVGATLARRQGIRTLRRIQDDLAQGRMPTGELVNGLMILVAGAVLITPGIITDAFGFALLIPPIRELLRRRVVAYFKKHAVMTFKSSAVSLSGDDGFIDVEACGASPEERNARQEESGRGRLQ